MNDPQTDRPFRMAGTLALALCGFLAMALPAQAEELDTLYLRDGSILRGTVVPNPEGNYFVYTPYGELDIDHQAVVFSDSSATTAPLFQETHIFIDATSQTLSIVDQPVPERDAKALSFNLLIPGVVASVLNESGDDVPFKSRQVGENSLLTLQYADLAANVKRLRVAIWRADLLTSAGSGQAAFEQKYTPDHAGLARVTVKYPTDWTLASVMPPPAQRLDGLIVWRTTLRRQQDFTPRIVFNLTPKKP